MGATPRGQGQVIRVTPSPRLSLWSGLGQRRCRRGEGDDTVAGVANMWGQVGLELLSLPMLLLRSMMLYRSRTDSAARTGHGAAVLVLFWPAGVISPPPDPISAARV